MCHRRILTKIVGILAVLSILFTPAVMAGEERTDGSGQWMYAPQEFGVTVTGYVKEPAGILAVPNELDGYPVTGIGDSAFADCMNITGVTIPNSVIRIEAEAFARCYSLAGVVIPDSVNSIGEWAFKECVNLVDLTIGSGVTVIGDMAFFGCESLTNVTMPDSGIVIGEAVFGGCVNLTLTPAMQGGSADNSGEDDVTTEMQSIVSGQWTYVPVGAGAIITDIKGSPGGDLTIPSMLDGHPVIGIGDCALADCYKLAGVTIPNGVTSIGKWAFYNSESLRIITLPNSVISIGEQAFINSALESVTLPNGLTSISEGLFTQCSDLKYVTIPDSVTHIGDSAFTSCGRLEGVAIPGSVTHIGNKAFAYCGRLTVMTIPSGVVFIGTDAFSRCNDLVLKVEKGSYAEQYAIENEIQYDTVSQDILRSIAETLIGEIKMDASGLWKYELKGGLVAISDYKGKKRGSLKIPGELDGHPVTGIGRAAFYMETGLTGITIPQGVTSIGREAFSGCEGLKTVTLPNGVVSIGDFAFEYCSKLAGVVIPDSVTAIGKNVFYECAKKLTLSVKAGSYAEQYAKDNKIAYKLVKK